jgi:hypothetical protein
MPSETKVDLEVFMNDLNLFFKFLLLYNDWRTIIDIRFYLFIQTK